MTDPEEAITGRTLPPPELARRAKPASVGELVPAPARGMASIARRTGRGRAELATLTARVRDAAAAEDKAEERTASAALARALAARGAELDRATRLARRALALGDDPALRADLASWLSSLGEPSLSAATLRGLVAGAPSTAERGRTLVRIAVLLARAGDGEGAVDALTEAIEGDARDPMPRELLGAVAAWAEGAVSAEEGARAFLDAADLRADRGEPDGAVEDHLRAFELAPGLAEAADAVAADLVHEGRVAAADEIRRISARHMPPEQAAAVHRQRFGEALAAGDVPRALAAMLDAGFEAVGDPEIEPTVDDVLRRAGLDEVVAARLARRARLAPPERRAELLRSMARLASGSLALPDLALEAWLDAFSLDPRDEAARSALRDRAARAGDHEPLVEGLVRVASRTDVASAEVARTAARELASTAEDALGDAALATWALRRLETLGGPVPAGAIARLAPAVSRHSAELEIASREVASGAKRIDALRTVAARLRSRPDERGRLIEALAALVRASSDDATGPMRLLERVIARRDPPSSAEELQLFESVLRDRLAAPTTRSEAVRLRMLLGALLEDRGEDAEAAVELAALLDEAPGHPLGTASVLLASTRAGLAADRGIALAHLAESLTPPIRAAMLAVASELLLQGGDAARARDEARRATEADPSSARAASALTAVAGGDRDEVAAQVLERRMGMVVPQGLLCAQLADALEELGEGALALAWTERWAALAPGDRLAAGELLRRAIQVRDVRHLEDAIARVMGRPAPLGDLALGFADAIAALGEVQPDLGRAAARRALDVFGPRGAALRETAVALADRDRDVDLGVTALERWYAADAGVGTSVLIELSRRRADGGDLGGAARDLLRAADAGGDPERLLAAAAVLEARAARIEGEGGRGLGPDGEVAIADATARALVASGVRDGVLLARALRHLGGALWDLAADYRGAEQAFYAAAAHMPKGGLERYARDLWEFAGAADASRALEERAETLDVGDRSGRASLLALLAMLSADEGRFADALRFALIAIESDPAQAHAVATVERCAHVEGGLDALDTAYDLLARAAMGKFGRRAAHYRAARQLERRGSPERALAHAIDAFESVPEEGSSYLLLARLADITDRSAQVTSVLERVAESAPAEDRPGWLRKAARLQGQSLDGVRTRFELLLRALHLTIDADLLTGVGAAARDLVAAGEPLDHVAMRFERAVSAALPKLEGEPGARAALVIAETALTSLGEGRLAAAAVAKAIALGPELPTFDALVSHVDALTALPAIARGLVADVMRGVVDADDEFGFAATLPPGPPLLRLGLALARALGDEAATNRLGVALAKAEANRTPVPPAPHATDATSAPPPSLSRLMTSEGAWQADPGMASASPPATSTPSPPADGRASVAPRRTSAPPLALRPHSSLPPPPVRRASSRPPSGPPMSPEAAAMSLEQLEREAQQRGDHDAVAVFLARRIQGADSPETRRLLRLRRAAVLEQRLGRPEEACRELEKLIVEFPDDRSALPFLADLYARLGDAMRSAPLWDRMASRPSATDDERTEYGVRAVRAFLEAGNAIAAREAFARAAAGAPGDVVAELRAEIARASGDHEAIVTSLDEIVASGAIEEPERLATLLVEAARAASASGDLMGALTRARRAVKLDPSSADAVLEATRLEYRQRGGGTPREAQAAIDDLARIADALRPPQVELHAFLRAEMLDVVQGGGAGMRELSARHAEIGSTPLLALGMAERLARAKSFASALPLYQRALEGDFGGLRSRTRVLLAAADAAAHAGDPTLALRLAEEAEAQHDGKSLAHRKRLEIVAKHGPRPSALAAAEELATSSTGAARARAVGLLARLYVDADPDRAEALYGDAIKSAAGDRQLVGRLTEELEALRQGEPPPPSVVPVAPGDLHADLAIIAAQVTAAAKAEPPAAAHAPPPMPLPAAALPESDERELDFSDVGRSMPPVSAEEERVEELVFTPLPDADSIRSASRPAPPPQAAPTEALEEIEERLPESLDVDSLVDSALFEVATPAPPPAEAPADWVRDTNPELEPLSSRPPPSLPPASWVVPPPPPSSRVVAEGAAETMLLDRLYGGDAMAGDEVIELWGSDALARRPHDVLSVRRRQLGLMPHRIGLLRATREAALADGSPVYARALEHVLAVAGAQVEPVRPPATAGHVLAPELAHSLLFRELVPPVLELLSAVWETGIARKDPAAYGLTGAERVSLAMPTPLARLLASLAPLFGQARSAYFLAGPEPPRVRPALLAQPAILVTGNPHDDDPHLIFQLGSTWAATLPEYAIVLGSPEFTVRNLLDAVRAAFGPVGDAMSSATGGDVARTAADLYQRVLPRNEKKIRAIFAGDPDVSYETARDTARLAARRAGLFACGDLSTALAFVASDLGLDLAHAATPEGFEHAVANVPEVADLVRLATRMEYAQARWDEGGGGGGSRGAQARAGVPGIG